MSRSSAARSPKGKAPFEQAIPHGSGYRYAPFPFSFVPFLPGAALDADVALYKRLSDRCSGLAVGWHMLGFLGSAAEQLFLRRAGTKERWEAFHAEAERRHPDIAARAAGARKATAALAADTTSWRISMFEVIVADALGKARPATVRISGNERLATSPSQPAWRSDFTLRSTGGPARCVHVEVNGFMDRLGTWRTLEGAGYAARQPERLKNYAECGLPPPVFIYADEVCDEALLKAAIAPALAPFAAANA